MSIQILIALLILNSGICSAISENMFILEDEDIEGCSSASGKYIDLTLLDWTIQCTTQDERPVMHSNQNNVSLVWERMRDYNTRQGQCEQLGLRDQVLLPKGSMPGEVHKQLMSLGLIDRDVLYRFEHINQNWITLQDWSYETQFSLSREDKKLNRFLKLTGVGTFADVFLNDHLIGQIDNLFRDYYLDLHEYSVVGSNSLRIEIQSTVRMTYELKANYHKQYEEGPMYINEWISWSWIEFARSQQTDLGWDWSPALAPQGIFGQIQLIQGLVQLENPQIHTKVTQNDDGTFDATVNLTVQFRGFTDVKDLNTVIEASLTSPNGQVIEQKSWENTKFTVSEGMNKQLIATFLVKNAQLWKLNSLAEEQNLYNITIKSRMMTSSKQKKLISLEKHVRYGIRDVKLIQEPIDCAEQDQNCKGPLDGRSFYFKINGEQVYMRGANMVPIDYFPWREKSKQEIDWLIESALQANINILRIWGGGVYPTDYFFERADERGLMIWHDLMFSCKIYPMHSEEFIQNSLIEIREQVGRIAYHSSVVFWDLNNEGETMMYWGNYPYNFTLFKQEYKDFYIDQFIPAMIESGVFPNDTTFLDTSPSNGLISIEPYVKRWKFNPGTANFGDNHYYYLVLDCEKQDTYPAFRFLSESGFQSEPSFQDYREVSLPRDWSQNSRFVKLRTTFNQDHEVMVNQSRRHYKVPKDVKDQDHFSYYTWLTQVQQGMCMKVEFERQKRFMSTPNVKNMGTIYWQFNSNWQGPGWTTLDYSGNWKVSHNMIKDVFSPLQVNGFFTDENQLSVHVINEDTKPKHGTVKVQTFLFNQTHNSPVVQKSFKVSVPAQTAMLVHNISNELLIMDDIISYSFVRMELFLDGEEAPVSTNHAWPQYLKFMKIPSGQPNLKIQIQEIENTQDRARITIKNEASQEQSTFPSIFTSFTLDNEKYEPSSFKMQASKMSESINDMLVNSNQDAFKVGQLRGYFTSNVFTLLPGETLILEFVLKNSVGRQPFNGRELVQVLEKQIKVRTYNEMLKYTSH